MGTFGTDYEIPDNADEVTGKNKKTVAGTDMVKWIITCIKKHAEILPDSYADKLAKDELVAIIANQRPADCVWIEDADGYWNTKCDEDFCFIDGGPKENRIKYCPYCGGKIIVGKAQ